ncbi:MAG: hypothetical protein HDT44_00555 [Ruminococcaceae bacterium]|nr:hypothetical protein [Oscillospiraceae bacterium]
MNLTQENKIKIVDDIMGSGKSRWAINYINSHPEKKFLCVVPFLPECERYKKETIIEMFDPKLWGTKKKSFINLIEKNDNIVTTHALIQKMDLTILELLRSRDYTLIIDECLEVLAPYKISNDDRKIIFREHLVSLDNDGFLIWNEEKNNYKGAFKEIKELCSFKSLMGFKNEDDNIAKILMWNFPVDFFKCFKDSYILTYLWNGSIQKSYFDIHSIQYEKYMLDKDGKEIIPHSRELELRKRKDRVKLLHIYEGKFNDIGNKVGKSNPLSKSWYERQIKAKNFSLLEQIKKNTENYFRTVTKSRSADNMYTVFKPFRKYIKGRLYSNCHVACNAKATNNYSQKKYLAYLINEFISPDIKHFVNHYQIEFDEDLFALSALLQWIWRSQIRNGEPIELYLPSERMRNLLLNWINEVR